MNNIPISYLLDMSDIEATNWLIENCHDYVLVKRAAIKQLRAENEALKRQLALAEMIADSAETYIQEGRFIAYCKETDTLRKQKEQLAKGGE